MSIIITLHTTTGPRRGGTPEMKTYVGTFFLDNEERTFAEVLRRWATAWIPDKCLDSWRPIFAGSQLAWDSPAKKGTFHMSKRVGHWSQDNAEENVLQYFVGGKSPWKEGEK